MPYNLLREQWIPVWRERPDGSRYSDNIRPSQISEPEDPPIALAASRPDFNGALIQFLIGLVQTAFSPRTERDWRGLFTNAPDPNELHEAFCRYEHAFNLDGDGPRFMQDADRAWATADRKPLPMQSMLLDAPGTDTAEKNMDHFVKTKDELEFSEREAALALHVYQTNKPATAAGKGGQMHSPLRGACPTTVVVLADTLWRSVWINVLTEREFEALAGMVQPCDDALLFPWLDYHNSLDGRETYAHEAHAAQTYWGMPQRIVLGKQPRSHAIEEGSACYPTFQRISNGTDYKPEWHHPLQPGTWLNADFPTYRGWTSFSTEKGQKAASLNIKRFNRIASAVGIERPNLWVFAYEKARGSSAAIRGYHEVRMPLFVMPPAMRPNFEDFAHQLISAADEAANALRRALKSALFGTWKKDKTKWDYPTSKESKSTMQQSQIADAATRFWRDTEQAFYAKLEAAKKRLEERPDVEYEEALEALAELRGEWYRLVREHIRARFDEVTQWGTFHASRPRSVGRARRELLRDLGKLKKTLALASVSSGKDLNEEGGDG